MSLKRPTIIRRTADLRRLVDTLKSQPLLAVDTESNSLFAYYERVCLVQLSTREADYIVDPLAVDDMSPLGALLADPAIEIVFHAAEYDIITLKRDFGYTFSRIFDPMLAARICGWKKLGLGNILEELFNVQLDKKYQRADWSQRPLPDDQLRYAQMDTHYLPDVRDRLLQELITLDRLEEARETFAELSDLPPAGYHFDPEGYWRIHETRDLKRSQMAIVRELYLLRDQIAQRWDWPVFKVFSDQTLVQMALLAPRRTEDLYAIKGLSERLIQRNGDAIIEAVARGRRAEPPNPPQRADTIPSPDVIARYEALHEWRKQRAAERGVESDVIVPRGALWALARRVPATLEELDQIPGLGPWRRAEYGEELLNVLARAASAPE
ncbi:MAG: ribonuclease D [Chloroflexi bacterium]|nr:MAG: ribonuclease D [Chloroflexota bacterium]